MTGISLDMVDLVGRGYVVEYCISLFRKKQEQLAFQSYIADVLYTLNNSFAKALGGTEITTRYIDLIKPKVEDTRTGDEIAEDIIARAGLSFGTEEPDE